MASCFSPSGKKRYFYYRCRIGSKREHYARTCGQTKHFRADHVDARVWQWVRSYLADPTKLAEGLAAYQSEREQDTAPLRDRLTMLEKLIADNRGQLDRLLDLYLTGDFSKDTLLERKTRLMDTITAQEREREMLVAQLTAHTMTRDEVQSMFAFAAEVAQGLEAADHDFETRRRIAEILDVRVTLSIEEGQEVIYPSCRFFNGESLLVVNKRTDVCRAYSLRLSSHKRASLAAHAVSN